MHDPRHRLFRLLHDAGPLLIDLGETGGVDLSPWGERVRLVAAGHDERWELPLIGAVDPPGAVVIRPDGHVAWTGSPTTDLRYALTTWCGEPAPPVAVGLTASSASHRARGTRCGPGGPAMTAPEPHRYVVGFEEIDRDDAADVGGKAANLGELSRIDGVGVPPGFCVTTAAFDRALRHAPSVGPLLDRLSELDADNRDALTALSAEVRQTIATLPIPDGVAAAITDALVRSGDRVAFAVRSSATAEDLPAASFAGQHDSYLNLTGTSTVLEHVRLRWASLFTERAIAYRVRNGIDHRQVRMAVVIQRMVEADVSGVVFTADPATSNRLIVGVEATFGLGEGLVFGRVDADRYRVRGDEIVARTIAAKHLAAVASPAGGTVEGPIDPDRRTRPALTDAQVLALARLGRRIEAHFGVPQDIEWCLVDGEFQIVQSRPITTLFPIPPADDDANHIYVSVGHGQMMTDPMRPLGLSFWQMTTPAPMVEAGGRLFVDVTTMLASPASRPGLLAVMGRGDPLIRDALEAVIDRGDFLPPPPDPTAPAPTHGGAPVELLDADPTIVSDLIETNRASVEALGREIVAWSGPELFDEPPRVS